MLRGFRAESRRDGDLEVLQRLVSSFNTPEGVEGFSRPKPSGNLSGRRLSFNTPEGVEGFSSFKSTTSWYPLLPVSIPRRVLRGFREGWRKRKAQVRKDLGSFNTPEGVEGFSRPSPGTAFSRNG